jgi:uncharacterized protein YcbK (DUF882 family)
VSVTNITPNFAWAEFACHDGTGTPIEAQPNLRRLCGAILEPLRLQWGGPIIIISGYRSPLWNFRIHGAEKSRHVVGDAADIRPVAIDRLPSFKSMLEDMLHDGRLPQLGGLGLYEHWVHVDGRPRKADGTLARWSGIGVGSEVA